MVLLEQAVKVDVGMEVDLGSALEIHQDKCPQLIFIKNGKALHKLEGISSYLYPFMIPDGEVIKKSTPFGEVMLHI